MYVCHCRAVTDREIRDSIAAGAADLDEVARRCGAGITCGGCCPLIEQLLAEHAADRAAPHAPGRHAAPGRRGASAGDDLVAAARR